MTLHEIILFSSIAILAVVLFGLWAKQRRAAAVMAEKLDIQNTLLEQLGNKVSLIEEQLAQLHQQVDDHYGENTQVSKQLEHRINTVKQDISSLQSHLQTMEQQAPEDKFYSRALKLAQRGADVDDIVQECDIPRAEAEMLLAVHQRKK